MFNKICPGTGSLEDYILNHDTVAVRVEVGKHLLDCETCRARLAEQQTFLQTLRVALRELSAYDVAMLTSSGIHERRKSARRRVDASVWVLVVDEVEQSRIEHGTVRDISESGAGLHVASEPRVGLAISFLMGKDVHSGVVRHVRRAGSGYLCGVQFFTTSALRAN